MVLSFAGCGSQSRIGKRTKFVSTETMHWIRLYKSWSETSGSGECSGVLEYKYSGGSWSASGEFSYDDSSFWFTGFFKTLSKKRCARMSHGGSESNHGNRR